MEKTMSQTKLKVIENHTMDKENRTKSLEAAVSLIEKNYGKGSIMKLGSKTNVDIEAISTTLKNHLIEQLSKLQEISLDQLLEQRYQRIMSYGNS